MACMSCRRAIRRWTPEDRGLWVEGSHSVGGSWGAWARAGGVLSYGPNVDDMYRHAIDYIDQILKGGKPATFRFNSQRGLNWSSRPRLAR